MNKDNLYLLYEQNGEIVVNMITVPHEVRTASVDAGYVHYYHDIFGKQEGQVNNDISSLTLFLINIQRNDQNIVIKSFSFEEESMWSDENIEKKLDKQTIVQEI